MSKAKIEEESKNLPAVKITGKTKFTKDSVEAVAIRDIKKREKKITSLGKSLVSLWIAQGQEIIEFLEITEVSQRVASELLGVKRTALNTYVTIASDPRMISGDFAEALENFSQKDLIKLTKIDDEEAFDKAMTDGELPKAEKAEVIDVEVEETEVEEAEWKTQAQLIYGRATSLEDLIAQLEAYRDAVEVEPESDPIALINEAIELTGEENPTEQALAIGIKKSIFKKALDGTMSAKTRETVTTYVNS